MKKLLLSIGLIALFTMGSRAQIIIDTVSVGAGYANQKYYSLQNDEQGTQGKDNWDIGFEITGYAGTILANTQKANFTVYKAPYSIANYAIIDTTGIISWPMLYNSDQTWDVGAFNRGANPFNSNDLGWGVYDVNTHIITGDSCYVIKLSAASYKKVKFENLSGGIYTFEYANINGTSSQTATINKSNYTGKNFAYYDMTANVAVDREPVSANWDLTFGRYTAFIPTAYPVVGVMSNKGVKVAQADNVTSPSTYNTWSTHNLNSNITEIGHDWKYFNLSNNAWWLAQDTVYFVKDKPGNIWKIRFTAFGGSTTGNVVFSKEKLSTVGITDVMGNIISKVTVYPNPSNGSNTTLLFSNESEIVKVLVSIIDLNGKLISEETITTSNGINLYNLNTQLLNSGVYFIQLNAGGNETTQKLIIQ
ncbi:MAG: T9SS type A sorting domain-containing protein [Bacteroidia bacterium]|nr:T9SS type A sorting domain-containing protein [Bacteroidia bacterium]